MKLGILLPDKDNMQSDKRMDNVQETVLLRYAKPKYEFKGKKLSRQPSVPKASKANVLTQQGSQQPANQSNQNANSRNMLASQEQSHISTSGLPNQSSTMVPPKTLITKLSCEVKHVQGQPQMPVQHFADHNSKLKSAGVVKPVAVTGPTSHYAGPVTSTLVQLPQKPIQMIQPGSEAISSTASKKSHVSMPMASETILQMEQDLGSVCHGEDQFLKLKKENERLKQDLEVQIKVNGELKKLLVASVGDDLQERVERLVRDKAELSLEVGGYSKKVTEDYENLDKISIQADMWRSKFLASRVMIDELASARAFYALQYQESQDALQQLLTERHELRANLLEAFKCLQQVKGAFDPLNAHRSTTLPSTNVIDLAKKSHQLAEAIRYRLLPGQLNIPTLIDIDDQLENSLTRAESFAQELVSRETSLDPVHKSVSGNLFGPSATASRVQRFHPHASFDNLTMNCCAKCKGEINVL